MRKQFLFIILAVAIVCVGVETFLSYDANKRLHFSTLSYSLEHVDKGLRDLWQIWPEPSRYVISQITQYARPGRTAEIYLVDATLHMRSASRFFDEQTTPGDIRVQNEQTAFFMANRTTVGAIQPNIIQDYRNVWVFSVIKVVEYGGDPYALFSEIDYEEAIAPMWHQYFWSAGLISVILVGCIVMPSNLMFSDEWVKQNQTIVRERDLYRAAFQESSAPQIIVSRKAVIVDINRELAQIMQYTPLELRGTTIHKFAANQEAHAKLFAAFQDSGETILNRKIEPVCKDGSRVKLNLGVHKITVRGESYSFATIPRSDPEV